jgi:hypothetical protein
MFAAIAATVPAVEMIFLREDDVSLRIDIIV